jgi:hypothetical protein
LTAIVRIPGVAANLFVGGPTHAAILALIVAWPATAVSTPPQEWSKVPAKNVKLFYPGQSSYQWLRSPAHKRAYKKTIAGDSCISCHEGEEQEIGKLIVSGKRLEPHPIAGKQAVIDLAVQAAHDEALEKDLTCINCHYNLVHRAIVPREGLVK